MTLKYISQNRLNCMMSGDGMQKTFHFGRDTKYNKETGMLRRCNKLKPYLIYILDKGVFYWCFKKTKKGNKLIRRKKDNNQSKSKWSL